MTPTIQNPSWEAEHHEMCQTGWRLRLAFWGDTYTLPAYEAHVRTCEQCQEYFAELRAAARAIVEQDTELIDEEARDGGK